MPAKPGWFSKINEVIRELEALPRPFVDRAAVEFLLGVGRRRAQQILAPCIMDHVGAMDWRTGMPLSPMCAVSPKAMTATTNAGDGVRSRRSWPSCKKSAWNILNYWSKLRSRF